MLFLKATIVIRIDKFIKNYSKPIFKLGRLRLGFSLNNNKNCFIPVKITY